MKEFTQIISTLTAATMLLTVIPTAMADEAAGKAIYMGKGICTSCHGPIGKGDGPATPALNPKPQDFSNGEFVYDTDGDGQKGTDSDLFNIIKDGTSKYGGAVTMPGRPDIQEQEIKALVAYIRYLIK